MADTEQDGGTRVPARIELFGFESTPADVAVVPRTPGWRASRALLYLAVSWALVPVVGLVPPHIPWAATAFIAGIVLAVRKATESHTLVSLQGTCPKCGAAQTIDKPTKLKQPHALTCPECHHDLQLRVDAGAAAPPETRSAA